MLGNDVIHLESSPSPSLSASAEEIRRHYRSKEHLLVAKAQALLEKEKQLLMWEKELFAKQETLYWKERCMKHEIGDTNGRKIEVEDAEDVDDLQPQLRDMNTKLGDVKGSQLGALQAICSSDSASTNGSSSIAALLLANKVSVFQSRPYASSTLTVTNPSRVLTSPSVLTSASTAMTAAVRPQPVNILPHVRPVPSDDVACSPRLAVREAAPESAALHFPAHRVVFPLRVTPPITQHKSRILPVAMNLRHVSFDAGSPTALEPVKQTGVASSEKEGRVAPVSNVESRVLPRVSSTMINHRPTSACHIPLHVVDSGDTSDDQESPMHDEPADNAVDITAAAANSSTTNRVNGSVEQAGQPIVSLEQIRLSTERIVKQFHRQNSSNADVMKDGNLQLPRGLQLVAESDSNPEADSSSSVEMVKTNGISILPLPECKASNDCAVDGDVTTKSSVNSVDTAVVESSIAHVTSSSSNLAQSSGLLDEQNNSHVCSNSERLSDEGSEQVLLSVGGDNLKTDNSNGSVLLDTESGRYDVNESAGCAVADTYEKLDLAETDNCAGAFVKCNESFGKRKLDNEVGSVERFKVLRTV